MKRILSGLLACLLVFSLIPAVPLTTHAAAHDGFTYTLSDGKATITDYTGTNSKLVIPAVLNGYPVAYIGQAAFQDCTTLTSVTISDGILGIGYSAFYGCNNLTKVVIGESVTDIGDEAFYRCTSLATVSIPGSVTSIGDDAFCECTSLTTVSIPDGVTSIGDYAFYKCTGLTTVSIPDSVTYIGDYAFFNCDNLTHHIYDNGQYLGNENNPYVALMKKNNEDIVTCDIHENTVIIAPDAFANCTKLTNIIIPSGVTSIGDDAFCECTSLTTVSIPDGVTSIGSYAFYGCTGLTSVSIPASVTSIGAYAFSGCTGLTHQIYGHAKYLGNENNPYLVLIEGTQMDITSCDIHANTAIIADNAFSGYSSLTNVTMGENVTHIGNYAFKGCAVLTEATMSRNVTHIGNYAFQGCAGLGDITFPDSVVTIGESAFEDCTSLVDITLSDSVTTIGGHAFDGCVSLISVNLGNGITSMGSSVFYYCDNLTNVILGGSVTSIDWHTFYACYNLTSITIPASVTDIGWNAFSGTKNLADVWYSGSAQQQSHIYVDLGNSCLKDATWHYDICAPDDHVYAGTSGQCINCEWVKCQYGKHTYSYVCDRFCDICGDERQAADHTYDTVCDTDCNVCGENRTVPHVYDSVCDDLCNVCNQLRTPPHNYTNRCDTQCNSCGNIRITTHIFEGENCSVCRAPVAPTLQAKTDTTVTLTPTAGYQYSLDAATWQASHIFTGLSPNTQYTFYQRLVDSSIYYISPASDPLILTTEKSNQSAPAAPTLGYRTDTEVRLTWISGYEYSMDGINWQRSSDFYDLKHNTKYTFYQRRAATDTDNPSPASPGLEVTTYKRTGTILYITDSSAGTYFVRYKLEGVPLTIEDYTPYGYRYYGWSTKSYGTLVYRFGDTYLEEASLTLYALGGEICDRCDGDGRINIGGSWTHLVPCPKCDGVGAILPAHPVTKAPELAERTSGSIILRQHDGMEYSIDGGTTWQESPVFTGLEPNTEYQFYQRYADKEYHIPAKSLCPPLVVSTKNSRLKPDAPVLFSASCTQVILMRMDGCEYSADGVTWQGSNIFTDLQPATVYTFYQRYIADGELDYSPASHGLAVTTAAHSYAAAPEFSWAENYSQCTATVTCVQGCGHRETQVCTITRDTSDPAQTVYTAQVTIGGVVYTDTAIRATVKTLGDTNGDGKVNMKDWACLYDHINEISPLPEEYLECADVNGDGKVNMKVWARLYEHINEINPLP